MLYGYLYFYFFVFITVNCHQQPRYSRYSRHSRDIYHLSEEDLSHVVCREHAIPYNGPERLRRLLSERLVSSNGKYTYYVDALNNIIRVSNYFPTERICLGVFNGFEGDPYSNREVTLQYRGCERTSIHNPRSIRLAISCSKDIGSPIEIDNIQENGHNCLLITAESPMICTNSPEKGMRRVNQDALRKQIATKLRQIEEGVQHLQSMIDAYH